MLSKARIYDFMQHKDFNRVFNIQMGILSEYKDDISKHVKGKEKQLIRMCYDAIPKQLAKELKKLQYSTIEKSRTEENSAEAVNDSPANHIFQAPKHNPKP